MTELNTIRKCQDGEAITWGEYCEGAERTLSNNFFANEHYPLYLAMIKLNNFIAAGNELDGMKKALFYGKDLDKVKLEIEQREASLDGLKGIQYEWPTHIDPRLIHSLLGIATEAVELVESLMTALVTGNPIDKVNLGEELGDIFWFITIPFNLGLFNEGLNPILRINLLKLYARFPDKFDMKQAINRDLLTERSVLETL